MTFALVGLGNAGLRAHLPAIARLQREGIATLVGAADPNSGRRAVLAGRNPTVPTFSSATDLLAATRPDVLVVATHPRSHPELARAGVEHGAHVLCEKPLALSRSEHTRLARTCKQAPDLGLVPVHQYRYSPTWSGIRSWASRASRLRLPYALAVDVERNGTDAGAVTGWRTETGTGGMLADAGVHFLALASTIGEPLRELSGSRQYDESGDERVTASARIGSGTLKIRLWRGAPARHTQIKLRSGALAVVWSDQLATVKLGGRTVSRSRVDALSDRGHVDGLYLSLYRELATRLSDHAWRQTRTNEALAVGDALVTLLEQVRTDNGVIA